MKKTEKEKRNGKILRRFTKMIEGRFKLKEKFHFFWFFRL